ncbi:MAG TPA: hypothetical protein VF508_10655 [Pyrinomonadaceae bacterium]|jgi:L-lactate utilization protein LutB
MDAAAFIKEFGLPAAIIAGAAWFITREVWPFIKQRVEVAHSDRIAQQKEFFDTLSRFAELVTTQRQATLSALAQLTEQMEETARTLGAAVRLIEQLHQASTERERTRGRQ